MAERGDQGARRGRLITDTCSALKLLGIGESIYKKGVLKLGDLIIHPRLITETRKWHRDDPRRETYAKELALVLKLRSEPGITVDRDAYSIIDQTARRTRDVLGLSVGNVDIDQLVSCVHHELDLVTNDDGFARLAETFEVQTFTAERVLIEALVDGVLSVDECREVLRLWKVNEKKGASKSDEAELIKLGFRMRRGFIDE